MSTKVKITAVETVGAMRDIGAEAAKAMPPGRRARYYQDIEYTLEDGRKVQSQCRGLTKPKLAEDIAYTKKFIDRGSMAACFSDEGEFWGTSTAFAIGGV